MSDQESGAPREPLSVYAAIAMMVDQTASLSWQKLGLQHDPITGTLHQDLAQAKVAIDLTAHLSGLIESQLDEEDRRRIQNLIRDLRINFVERSKEANA